MNVFSFQDYRELLRAAVKERKQFEPSFGFHALADAARIQRPYLSKVMKGTAQLSSDQMFLISSFLKLQTSEQEFVQLLLDHDRTALKERKNQLAEKIRAIADKHRDSSKHLRAKTIEIDKSGQGGMTEYYLDPLVQIVHIAISIDHFSKNPSALSSELHIPGAQLREILATLERLGLAYREGSKFTAREPNIHLPKASPLYRAWRNQIKLLSSQRINQLNDQDAYSFSTVFSADQRTRKLVHDRFLEFLKTCESSVGEAPAKQVFQMSFDLFPWTNPK